MLPFRALELYPQLPGIRLSSPKSLSEERLPLIFIHYRAHLKRTSDSDPLIMNRSHKGL